MKPWNNKNNNSNMLLTGQKNLLASNIIIVKSALYNGINPK